MTPPKSIRRAKKEPVPPGCAPETGTADSGDLETDLPELFLSLGEAAKASQKAIAILIGEL
jgi:hypothetical protein